MISYRDHRLLTSRHRPWMLRYLAGWSDARRLVEGHRLGDLRGLLTRAS